ncbi:cadherin domain-containing protein [Microvirga sp. ACRRW]|uniref:cadherin domain-containing protein n=1 Tax=Microvirga sp. ACRRW TaxID=2918205 RepID=UPI001EF4841B|nr:cadherin domain-containing protein [Microvirga sp. ACRRW]MCG7392258.1 cadherin domain-containing protein [Microvirga sp. ACRRW]
MPTPITSIGPETRVNVTTASDQRAPSVTGLADGGWIVTWQSDNQDGSGFGIYQQRYDKTGAPVSASDIRVNLTTNNHQADPSVTALPDGGWIVTWVSQGQDVSWNGGIYQQRYDKNGVALFATDKLVNGSVTFDQSQPSVTTLSDGGWVVTWVSEGQDGSGPGVFQQRYNASGTAIGTEAKVNALTDGNQNRPVVTALKDGGWIVTWESHTTSGAHAIYQQRYSASGVASAATDLPVETTASDYKVYPSITALADGGWIVTWTTYSTGGDIVQQHFNKDGVALFSAPQRINATLSGLQEPAIVTALKDGGWVVVWQSAGQDGSGNGIYLQAFDKDGNAAGPADMLVNTTTAGNQEMPSVTALSDGWIVTWQSAGQDGDGYGIYQKRYFTNSPPTDVTLSRTIVNEDVTGVVATLDGVDPNAGDTFTFALTEDTSGKFVVVGNELRLKDGESLDYETATSHTIKITVTDQTGLSYTKSITITVKDVAENRAPTGVTLSRTSVDEDETGLIATLDGVDADSGDSFTFTLAEDASGKFVIVGNELRLKDGESLDYETAKTHTIKITVKDKAGDSITKTVLITVNDIADTNDAPTDIRLNGGLGTAIAEDATIDTFIGVLSATDKNGDPVTFHFSPSGDAGGLFVIDPLTNQIKLAPDTVLDYEALASGKKYYTLTVYADDGRGGVSAPQTITIGITDVNERPDTVITGTGPAGALVVEEGAVTGTLVASLAGFDPEGDAISYALVDNAGGRFKIVGNEIRVANGTLLDFEDPDGAVHTLTLLVIDARGMTQVKTITVGVLGKNDAPTDIILSKTVIAENTTDGTEVGILSTVDQDAGDTHTYTLVDDAGGLFMLDATGTKILVADGSKLDFEAASSHTIRVLATDEDGLTYEKSIVITLTDVPEEPVNHAPVDITLSGGAKGNASVDENAGEETVVGTLGAIDFDSGDSFTYTLLDDAGGRFKLDATKTKIVVADGKLIDYEAATSYTIKVDVADGRGGTYTKSIVIAVNNINEAPTDIVAIGGPVDENTSNNVFVCSLGVIDQDSSGTYLYELVDNAGGRFKIGPDGKSILVANGALLDHETAPFHDITVRVTDGSHSIERVIRITLNDIAEAPPNAAPTDIALSSRSVLENAGNGTIIGDLSATDPNAGDTFTYTLVNDADGRFEIFGGKIRVKDGSRLDFENATSHVIKVRVTDKGGLSFEKEFVIELTDVDESTSGPANRAPVDITLSGGAKGNASVDENAGEETVVGSLGAVDPDTGDSFTYTLLDDAGGRFKLDATQTKIVVADGSLIDYEAAASYTIRVEVSDGKGGTYAKSITVAVNNINEEPTGIVLSGGPIDEGAANNIFVGSLSVIDRDTSGTYLYELVDNAGGRFKLGADGKSILVANGALLDYETASFHDITVRVTDGSHSIERVIRITLNDLPEAAPNRAPADIRISARSVLENAGNGTVIGLFDADDADIGDVLTYSLVDDAGGRFEIFNGKLRVKDGSRLDYEAASSHTITVRVTDKGGLSFEKEFIIDLVDVDDGPMGVPANRAPVDITLTGGMKGNGSVDENADANIEVGSLGAIDPDIGDSFAYELLDDADGRFKLDATKTRLLVADGSRIDYESATSYTIKVQVSDGKGGTFVKVIAIAVNNVNEEPLDIILSSGSVDENASNNTFVGSLSVLDRDATDTYTYELIDSAGGRFKIGADGKSILVANGALLDYETAPFHDITVRVKDGGHSIERVIRISLNDVAEAPANVSPRDITLSTLSVNENAKNGTLIGLLGAVDDNIGDTFTYTLEDDADGRFEIFNGRLRVKDGSRLDYEAASSHTIKVRVTDKGGLSFEKEFVIRLNDVDETPVNHAPTIPTVPGDKKVTNATDNGTAVNPFKGVTFADAENDTLTATISFNAADGDLVVPADLVSGGGSASISGGIKTYTFTAKADALALVMRMVQFNPTDRPDAKAGTLVTTTFTIKVSDAAHAAMPFVNEDVSVRTIVANRAPRDIGLDGDNAVREATAGDVVGTLSASGQPGSAFNFTLTDSAGGRFRLDGNTIVANNSLLIDYEQATSHTIKVLVSDGMFTFEKSFVVGVTDWMGENVTGSAGKDTIKGGIGNDVISGGSGDDFLYGGVGNDTLRGNAGKDAFVFDSKLDKSRNVDKIVDFNVKDDTIRLENAIFKKLTKTGTLNKSFFTIGPKAKDANDYIIYDNKKGILYYDADGSGKGAAVKFATITKNLKMTAADFLVI